MALLYRALDFNILLSVNNRALLIYLVLVFLLAWAPWNGWLLVVGGALYWNSTRSEKLV